VQFGSGRLPEHKRPKRVRFVSKIPRNANEKILRARLPDVFGGR
jgi:acyl-coenzyme A synthetase/AMP-(fatty) acid ligase